MRLAGQGRLQHWDIDGELAPTGVEQRVEGLLRFEGGAHAGFVCRLDGHSSNVLLSYEPATGWHTA